MKQSLRESLSRLEGTWRTEGRIVDGGEHHGETWAGYDIYEWFPGRNQMIHRLDAEIFGSRKEGIEVFSPRSASADSFDQTSYDADGTVEHAVGSFDAEGCYHNDLAETRAKLSFIGENSMWSRWEMKQPDGAWTDWMEVAFTRISAPHIEIRSKSDHTI